MGNTLEDIKTRRSIRAYTSEQVKDNDLEAILEAGTWAASGAGAQPAVIAVIQDKALISELEALNAKVLGKPELKPFYGAPTLLAVLADPTKPTPVESASLVLGNLMLAAHARGVGSCWIHRAKEVFEFPECRALLKKWGIPENYIGVGFCVLGYAADTPAPKPRKEGFIVKVK